MSDLKITSLHKHYGPVHAVKGVSLDIPEGEFTVLVGPSGCGKSTLLRTIAGLEEADGGTIEIGGRVVNHVRPRDRDIAMVFQNYALYPFMSVYENIAFGLRARKTPSPEIDKRVKRAAGMLGITNLLERLPRQLSGGQRQRVAIGRAIVRNARLFLFDEPLSNLDAQLRDEMRGEIKRLHQEIDTTMIYVTHDQIEAMTLADRIVLMNEGEIEQQGAPLDLFERPATRFVAGFLGSPQMNFVPGKLVAAGQGLAVALANGLALPWPTGRAAGTGASGGQEVVLGIRPEHMRRAAAGGAAPGHARIPAEIEIVQPTGPRTYINFSLAKTPVMAEVAAHDVQRPGERIELDIDMNRAVLMDAGTGIVIYGQSQPRSMPVEASMPAQVASRAVRLFGTDVPDVKGRTLRAGALTAVLDNGALRYIRLNDAEVMRAIAFLVRDENWGTFAPRISNLKVTETGGGFEVSYDATCADAKRSIAYKARISAKPDGTLRFHAVATPETDFLTNRTGFIVLHPLEGVAGHPVTVERVDGSVLEDKFPAIINPDCPFRDVRALTHQVMPGLRLTCRMEGDTFEMEDHRNWTDASFKTYVRPLALPWPYTLPKGKSFEQSVTLTLSGPIPAARSGGRAKGIEVTIGGPTDIGMPRIGLGLQADEAPHAVAAAGLIKRAGVQSLICQVDARQGDGAAAMRYYRSLQEETGAAVTLEVIIPGKSAPGSSAAELAPVAAALKVSGLKIAAVTVSPAPHLKAVLPGSKFPDCATYEDVIGAARATFPGIPLGGGMYSFFTELNRTRPPAHLLDFITHTTSPIVHAADDISVMETLEALPFVIQSTRAFIAGRPYRVGPSAIPTRDNPYGKASAENPDNGRVCLARMDPRQRGVFGAAWTLAYIAAFAKGGLEAVAIGAPTGPSGIIARRTETAQPYFDGIPGPAVYPVYHVIAGLASAAGSPLIAASSSAQASVAALAHGSSAGPVLWLANLTDAAQNVRVSGLPDRALSVQTLDESSFAAATTDASFLASKGRPLAGGAVVELAAYAVARIA